MFKKIFSVISLMAAISLYAETTPALVIGEGTKVALADIVSVKFDSEHLFINKVDGTQVEEPLQCLTFGEREYEVDLSEILNAEGDGRYLIYDRLGRLKKKGQATDTNSILEGLTPGTYIIQMNGKSMKVQLGTTADNGKVYFPQMSFQQTVVTGSSEEEPEVPTTGETAIQLGCPGIDPMLALSRVDSLSFSEDLDQLFFAYDGECVTFPIDELSYIDFPELQSSVTIQYADNDVEGANPFHFAGVNITNEGAGVVVTNYTYLDDEVEYILSGVSENGYFRIYSDMKWQATLHDLVLTNPNGSVINSQTGKKGTIKSPKGYENYLSDGAEYVEIGDEAQKGCLFSEGQLIFKGQGTLNIAANYKHAICSDDYVSFENGVVNVLSAAGDAVHAKDSVLVQSGIITLNASSDGIDCDGPITIREGENGIPVLSIRSEGDGAKGIKTGADFLMTTGVVDITLTGEVKVQDDDKSNVTGIKALGNITITGGELTIVNTAENGKGLSAEGETIIDEAATVNIEAANP